MMSKFCFLFFLFYAGLLSAEILDCSQIEIKDFKIKNCDASVKPCFVEVVMPNSEKSIKITASKIDAKSNFFGRSGACNGIEGKSEAALPTNCRIYFNFNGFENYENKKCTCNNRGCGQVLIMNVEKENLAAFKAQMSRIKSAFCPDLVTEIYSRGENRDFLVNSRECIFADGEVFARVDDMRRYCFSEKTLSESQLRYTPLKVALGEYQRIYAILCLSEEKYKGGVSAPAQVSDKIDDSTEGPAIRRLYEKYRTHEDGRRQQGGGTK